MNWKIELNKPFTIHNGKKITLKEYIFLKKGKHNLFELTRYKKYLNTKSYKEKLKLAYQIRHELEQTGKLQKFEPEIGKKLNNADVKIMDVWAKELIAAEKQRKDQEEWSNMTQRDNVVAQQNAKKRQANKHNPDDTSSWNDEDWDNFSKQNQKIPKRNKQNDSESNYPYYTMTNNFKTPKYISSDNPQDNKESNLNHYLNNLQNED